MSDVELPDPEELEEQKKNVFSRRVALCTALFAVVLAITSLGGSNAAKEVMLYQQQASNQWAYYQSKVMREHLYRLESQRVDSLLVERGDGMSGRARELYQQNRDQVAAEAKRYAAEKLAIEKSAKELEAQRDSGLARDPYFDYAEVLLQIAIVMASISILSGSLPVFGVAVVCAVTGGLLCLNGYLLLVRLPFL